MDGFEEELAEGLPLPTVGQFREKRNKPMRALNSEERERQAQTMRYGPAEWQEIMAWALRTGMLNDFQIKLSGTILGYAAGGWRQVPSPKQTKHAVEITNLWLAECTTDIESG